MKKRVVFISISIIVIIIIIAITAYAFVIRDATDNMNNDLNIKTESQAVTDSTQIAMEDKDMEMRKRELDEKMKTIVYGILHCTGEIEEKYNEENVNSIVKQMKIKNGIYISEKGRNKILTLINSTTGSNYKIDEDGYLLSDGNPSNEIAQKIEKLITGNKCIILDYNIYYYCILGDSICTFNIEKSNYMEKFENEDMVIMILNSSKYEEEYESKKDLVNQIIKNVM